MGHDQLFKVMKMDKVLFNVAGSVRLFNKPTILVDKVVETKDSYQIHYQGISDVDTISNGFTIDLEKRFAKYVILIRTKNSKFLRLWTQAYEENREMKFLELE